MKKKLLYKKSFFCHVVLNFHLGGLRTPKMCERVRSLLKELSDRDATWPTACDLRTLMADIHRPLQMYLF